MRAMAFCFALIAALFLRPDAVTLTAGGHIVSNTAWNADTVLVTDTLRVDSGVTLTLAPGTRVVFQGRFPLKILGRLLAQGATADSIVFTPSDTALGWQGIRFENTPKENDSSILVFCRIEYGVAANFGGGLYVKGFSKVRIAHCTIAKNFAYWYGGGIYCDSASPVIEGNTISNNLVHPAAASAWSAGGGIYCTASSPLITGNAITYNEARNIQSFGGGIYLNRGSAPLIDGNVISHNTAGWQGGGVCSDTASPVLRNNLICFNSGSYGGGIRVSGGSLARLSNNTICNNVSTSAFGGGLSITNASPEIINSIVWGNMGTNSKGLQVNLQNDGADPAFRNCDIQGGAANFGGSGAATYSGAYVNNLDLDPEFADSANGDFSLRENSPCVNSGTADTTGLGLSDMDLAENPRIYQGQTIRIDMGAYEFQGNPVSNEYSSLMPGEILKVSPNPFHSVAMLRFPNLSGSAHVMVYDVSGKVVKSFENLKVGALALDFSGMGNGLYLVRVMREGARYQKRITLLR